jgi:V/A-type H+-transporting ATPase subunit I
MGVVKLKKAELYYHKSVRDDVAKILQRSGVCQVIEPAGESRGPRPEGIDESLSACEAAQAHIRYLFRALGGHYTDPVSSLDRMLGERPSLSLAELAKTARETDLEHLASSVKKAEAELNELRIEVSQLHANAAILSNIKGLPYTLDILGEGTNTLKGVLGTLPAPAGRSGALTDALRPYAADTDVFVAQAGGKAKAKEEWAVVVYSRAREQEIFAICSQSGMTFVDLPANFTGSVSDESAKISYRLSECAKEEARVLKTLSGIAGEWMPAIQKTSDYWSVMRGRYEALSASDSTSSTVRTTFWAPEEALPALQKEVEAAAPGVAFVVSDPAKDDNPPTILRNNAFARPTDALTNLYSPPIYGELDPTPFLSPFFFVFFGMCLGDAGYALVIGGILWMLFKKYRKIPANVRDFINIFSIGAVTTFIYGVITGSFFGDSIDAFFFMAPLRGIKNAFFFLDPMGEPMKVLALSLFMGVCHLMFGLGIAAYYEFKKGNAAEAIGGKISWILFVVGLILIGGGTSGALPEELFLAAKAMAGVGACLIFWHAGRGTKNIFMKIGAGLYALYGSTSYLGDILSYSRLLALGLGSAVIGTVINLLGTMAAEIKGVGWLLFILIVVGGHAFSIAVNILGAFVHSMRLQYVEFFGKFYSGGGHVFKPLAFSTQYVEIADRPS